MPKRYSWLQNYFSKFDPLFLTWLDLWQLVTYAVIWMNQPSIGKVGDEVCNDLFEISDLAEQHDGYSIQWCVQVGPCNCNNGLWLAERAVLFVQVTLVSKADGVICTRYSNWQSGWHDLYKVLRFAEWVNDSSCVGDLASWYMLILKVSF